MPEEIENAKTGTEIAGETNAGNGLCADAGNGLCADVGNGLCAVPLETNVGNGLCAVPLEDNVNAHIVRHFEKLCREAEQFSREQPGFDLSEALKNPDFVRLTSPAVNMELRRAFYALNPGIIEDRAERRGAEKARLALSKSLAANALRPEEGGGRLPPAPLSADYRSMDKGGREELKKRIRHAAALGRKIYP